MNIKKQMQKEYAKDLKNIFIKDFEHLLRLLYKAQLSENIKRGIARKKMKKQ